MSMPCFVYPSVGGHLSCFHSDDFEILMWSISGVNQLVRENYQ